MIFLSTTQNPERRVTIGNTTQHDLRVDFDGPSPMHDTQGLAGKWNRYSVRRAVLPRPTISHHK